MANSKHITDTPARLLQGVTSIVQDYYDKQDIEGKIDRTVEDNLITTGVITKYYPYLNKCEVRLDKNNEIVLCKLLSLFGGDLLFLYTPSGDEAYDTTLNERCIIPRGDLNVLVTNINSDDDEYIMLGYYFPNELVGLNPSAQSQFKILAIGGVNEYSIKFGLDGLKITTNGEIEQTIMDDDEGEITTEKDYYSKSEVDELINNLREELSNGTTNEGG